MIKAVFFSHVFPPAIDGGSQILYQLSKAPEVKALLISSNCQTSDDFVSGPSQPIDSSVNILRIPPLTWLRKPLKLGTFGNFSDPLRFGPLFSLPNTLRIYHKLRQFQPDIFVAGPFPTAINLYALFFAKLFACPLVLVPCFHSLEPGFHSPLLRLVLHQANSIVTLSQTEKQFFGHLGLPTHKLYTLPAGVPPTLLAPKLKPVPKHPKLLYLGSESAHKNILLLIDTFVALLPKHPNLALTLGTVPTLYSQHISAHIAKLPPVVQQKITRLHSVQGQTKLNLLDSCSVLVNPSRAESFGLVFVEAWARGKAVVGSDIAPVKELITGNNAGLCASVNSTKSLIQSIDKLLSNPKLATKLGHNGYQAVSQQYLWPLIYKRFLQIIQNLKD